MSIRRKNDEFSKYNKRLEKKMMNDMAGGLKEKFFLLIYNNSFS